MNEWTICMDLRKQKRKRRRSEQEKCPHLVVPEKAYQLQRKLNIDGLATALLGTEAYELQVQGWIYTRVLRPDNSYTEEDQWEYTTIGNFNRWRDRLLFRRTAEATLCQADPAEGHALPGRSS
ncbi:hypothetical protein LCGC14_1867610 [marine sediment metagenome]|uniref:Uncharacterized protein n=1 Tax=marine sediment metagenome TaxID=412755 RepID=A0A0F9G5Z0_9ZZZZ